MDNLPLFSVVWIDAEREPQCAPNPRYPQGVHVDVSAGASKVCVQPLPYPAKRCGFYRLFCLQCGRTAVVTTAGRADDPKSVTLACNNQPKT